MTEPGWSDRPGCFERHLQRKHRNPLFQGCIVTPEEADDARRRDRQEATAFRAEVQALIERMQRLPDPALFNELNAVREGLDRLLSRSAELGASVTDQDVILTKLQDAVLRTMREAGDLYPEKRAVVQEAERRYRGEIMGPRVAFLAQALRSDSPIEKQELVPALLSEDPATVRAAVAALGDNLETLELLGREVAFVIVEAKRSGFTIPELEAKLLALGVGAQ